jgi:C-terminal processing protease CtpA/Prc
VVALVDAGSANTAELVADVLQESGDKLIGVTTFGDASDVRAIGLKDGSGFTLTVGDLRTASGRRFEGVGIRAQIVVPNAGVGDPVLDRAITELSGRVARVSTHSSVL